MFTEIYAAIIILMAETIFSGRSFISMPTSHLSSLQEQLPALVCLHIGMAVDIHAGVIILMDKLVYGCSPSFFCQPFVFQVFEDNIPGYSVAVDTKLRAHYLSG